MFIDLMQCIAVHFILSGIPASGRCSGSRGGEEKSVKAVESLKHSSVLSMLYNNTITKIVTYFNLAFML